MKLCAATSLPSAHHQSLPGCVLSLFDLYPPSPYILILPSHSLSRLCRFQIQPETGPLGGGILVTIHGSNLGVKADDVKKITVAGQNCAFEPKGYSVSTR